MASTGISELPYRHYAHPFDRPVKMDGDTETHGVDPSSEAIGGCYGMGWYEVFRDSRNGQLYQIHCSDGVNHGKSAHSDHHLDWMDAACQNIQARTKRLATTNPDSIRLSSREWTLMLSCSFTGWLDLIEGEQYRTMGDDNRHLNEGWIGTISGIPVVVDPSYRDDLPPIGQFPRGFCERYDRENQPQAPKGPSKFSGVMAAAFAAATVGG